MSRMRIFAACAIGFALVAQLGGLRLLVVSGNSMGPTIRDGDLVITSRVGPRVAVGDIVLVERPSDSQLLLHRVIEQGEGWRRTQGDASLSPDAERIPDRAVLGGLAAVIPMGLLTSLPLTEVLTQFSTESRIALGITSASGAQAVIGDPLLAGTDPSGRLLPGGTATWTLTLTPCPIGLAGECAGVTNTLRIEPERFALIATSSIARSLRIATTCRAVGATTWTDASDLFTAAWSATNLATGRLTSLSAGAAARECQVRITLLGDIKAANATAAIPLRWGPE
jgi:hypothetical protein